MNVRYLPLMAFYISIYQRVLPLLNPVSLLFPAGRVLVQNDKGAINCGDESIFNFLLAKLGAYIPTCISVDNISHFYYLSNVRCLSAVCAVSETARTHIAPHHDEVTPVKLARLAGVLLS